MVVKNRMSRFHRIEALRRLTHTEAGPLIEWCGGMLAKHESYIREHGGLREIGIGSGQCREHRRFNAGSSSLKFGLMMLRTRSLWRLGLSSGRLEGERRSWASRARERSRYEPVTSFRTTGRPLCRR